MADKGGQQGGTFLKGLAGVMGELAGLSVLPDAGPHVGFVNHMMSTIQSYLHHPQVGGQALGPGGPSPAGPPPGAGGPPGGAPGGALGGPPPGMTNQQPSTPNVDELRRMLQPTAA